MRVDARELSFRDMAGQAATRRGALVLLGTGLLAGCASGPKKPAVVSRRSGGGLTTGGHGLGLNPAGREVAVAQAMLLVNTPYRWGGNTPQGGFDCSGLITYVFRQVTNDSRALPRTTAQWASATSPTARAGLERGDLVFFNTTGARYSHMGLYVGDNTFVHAPSSGGTVHQTSLSNRYFAARFTGARRVFSA